MRESAASLRQVFVFLSIKARRGHDLHPPSVSPITAQTRWPGSRWPAGNLRLEESPGSRTTGRRLTAARREPRESATESKPPSRAAKQRKVRVKGWGKSPPQLWQQGWHGKPRPEQDQVGGAYGLFVRPRPGCVARGVWQQASQMNGCQAPQGVNRTRLTGHLVTIFCVRVKICVPRICPLAPEGLRQARAIAGEDHAKASGRPEP